MVKYAAPKKKAEARIRDRGVLWRARVNTRVWYRSARGSRWYIGACDLASNPHLAAGALDQHRRTRDGWDVALRGPLDVGLLADRALADAAFQPPDLRRKRYLRQGDRCQKPPQRHPRRGANKGGGGASHSPGRPPHEPAVPAVFRLRPPLFGDALGAPLRAALRRLLGPTRALQGPRSEERRVGKECRSRWS